MELISVIVPVYKVEPYLNKCISSIVEQTYKNLEIILVDDGSPDNCPEICDAWAKKDSRIKVIHQINCGAGAARNVGIDVAKGDFLAFVDSDDYLAPYMYETLYKAMQDTGADTAECDYVKVEDDHASFTSEYRKVALFTAGQALSAHIHDSCFSQLIWNKLYRRDLIQNVRFPIGMVIDDEFFTYQLIGRADRLVRLPCKMYAYRQQPNSVMHSMSPKRCIDAVNAKIVRHTYFVDNYPELVDESLVNLWLNCIYQGQLALRELDKQQAVETLESIERLMNDRPLPARCSAKEKLWSLMAKSNFIFTCRLRNLLKVGR